MATNQNGFPNSTAPFVSPSTGVINRIWYYLLLTLYNRTGGAQGNQPNAIVTLKPGASQFAYTANVAGNLWIAPGSAVTVALVRNGVSISGGTMTQGIFPMSVGDKVALSYSVIPTVYFV